MTPTPRKRMRAQRMLAGIAAAGFIAAGLISTPALTPQAHAEKSPTVNMPTFAPDVFYVYVKKGEYLWYNFQGHQPSYVLDGDGNSVNMTTWMGGMASPYAPRDGVYQIGYDPYIDHDNRYASNDQFAWNVQAVDSSNHTILGRVWADKVFVGQRLSFDWDNPATPKPDSVGEVNLVAVSPTGYRYQVNAKEYGGIQSVIAATSSGINKLVTKDGQDYCEPSYQSYDDWAIRDGSGYDAYAPNGVETDTWVKHYRTNYKCGERYKLFFTTPAADLPESILPTPKALGTPTVELKDLGNYKAQAIITGLDKFAAYTFNAAGKETTVQGKTSVTINIDADKAVDWTLKAASSNELHLMMSDVEMLGGLTIKALNGPTAGDATVYWDDTNLTSGRYVENTTVPTSALTGVNSDTPTGVHGWNSNNVNPILHREYAVAEKATYGDGRIIDTWARSGEAREWSGSFIPETPSISLVKTVTEKTYGDTSTQLHWTYTATNTGNVPLTNVHIIDDTYDGGYTGTDPDTVNAITKTCDAVQPGDTCTWENIVSPLVDADFPDAGKTVTNTAKTTGVSPAGITVTSDPSSDSSTYVPAKPAISIEKTVDKPEFHSGDKLAWTFTVTNTGDISLHDVTVVEDSYNGNTPLSDVSCPDTTLAVGASMTCTATSDTDDTDIRRGDVTNTAHATGISDGRNRNVESDQSTAKSIGKVTPVTVIPRLPMTGGTGIVVIAGIATIATLSVAGMAITYKRRSNKGDEN